MNMSISALKKIKEIGSAWLDTLSGAEQPKMYYDPQGSSSAVLEKLPQLQQKYRPTPWLSNTHAHLLYFDVVKKRRIQLKYVVLIS